MSVWDARQQAMLEAMGLRVWAPPPPPLVTVAAEPQAASAAPVLEAPAPVLRPTGPVPQPIAPGPRQAPAAVAALDWPQLREAVTGCRACGLCGVAPRPCLAWATNGPIG